MRRILFFLLSAALLCGAVQGYVLSIEAPGELRAGAPLLVSGTTTFPAGTQFDIVFYKLQFTTPQEIGRRMIVVGESKEFDASFPTTGLEAGHYKVEVQFLKDPGSKLGSDSVTLQQVEIIDRSGEIFLTAPRDQVLGEALLIEGYIPDLGVATITLRISGPAGFSLPDQFVRTTTQPGKVDGWFSYKVPVTEPGNYYVEIYDREGFMATVPCRNRDLAVRCPNEPLCGPLPPRCPGSGTCRCRRHLCGQAAVIFLRISSAQYPELPGAPVQLFQGVTGWRSEASQHPVKKCDPAWRRSRVVSPPPHPGQSGDMPVKITGSGYAWGDSLNIYPSATCRPRRGRAAEPPCTRPGRRPVSGLPTVPARSVLPGMFPRL
ncbi:MAG: hypothetical protein GKC05_04430 [Methanomicrobiales archaeon]|nr:hypothetical protein [Methanomicrobiales archaeon]